MLTWIRCTISAALASDYLDQTLSCSMIFIQIQNMVIWPNQNAAEHGVHEEPRPVSPWCGCQGRHRQLKTWTRVQRRAAAGAFGETLPVSSTEMPLTSILWVLITSCC